MLDAEYEAAQALAAGALPRDVALVMPLEAQGYGDVAESPKTTFLTGWSPAKSAALGAAGCKLLLPYRADRQQQAHLQDEVVRAAVEGCRAAGIALILEPIVYGETEASRFGHLVVEGAARLSELGPDVLKVQHPGSAAACRELDAACGRNVPWVLLGGGADGQELEHQIAEACAAGASGFIVGRTLWDVALVLDRTEEMELLTTTSLPLLERLGAVARQHATTVASSRRRDRRSSCRRVALRAVPFGSSEERFDLRRGRHVVGTPEARGDERAGGVREP